MKYPLKYIKKQKIEKHKPPIVNRSNPFGSAQGVLFS